MKKLITAIILIVSFSTSTFAYESYVIPGMWIGAITAGTVGIVSTAADNANGCSDDCDIGYFAAIGLGVLGGLIGAGIGASIPRESKITFAPTISKSLSGVNAGGNLQFKF